MTDGPGALRWRIGPPFDRSRSATLLLKSNFGALSMSVMKPSKAKARCAPRDTMLDADAMRHYPSLTEAARYGQ
jgi:hypothetical protein